MTMTLRGEEPAVPLPTGTVTFLMTDIEGSTRLWESRREAMGPAVARHFALLRRCIAKQGGAVFKSVGDGVYAVFATAPAAVAAALRGQKALHLQHWPPGAAIRVRMALHTGAADLREGDYYGQTMNRAARMLDLAYGGQILLSEVTRNLCLDLLPTGTHLKSLGEYSLKDLPRRESIHQLCADSLPISFPPLRTSLSPIDADSPSIAVLPFADLSPEGDQEYFTDGLAEELLNMLAKIRGLRVASRTSAFSFKGKDVDLPTIARNLNVATILEGSVRKSNNRLRITAQLIQVATDSHIWSETYDRDLSDIFAVQNDIAQAVVKALRKTLRKAPRKSLPKTPTLSTARMPVRDEVAAATLGRSEDPEAYKSFLQGRFFAFRWRREDEAKGIAHFQRAVERDPGFALAWAGMAAAHVIQAGQGWIPPKQGYERAREAAQRALALESELPEGHLSLGHVRMFYDWDWKGAEASYRRALELAPFDAEVLRAWANLVGNLGDVAEAVKLLRRAATLDPLSVPVYKGLGRWCLFAGEFDEAEVALKKALELYPNGGFAHCWLGVVHLAQGRNEEALSVVQNETEEIFRLQGMALALHAAGRHAEADAALKELIATDPDGAADQIAQIHAFRGETDLAFDWLERAFKLRDAGLTHAKSDRLLSNLHADRRWRPFLEKMGL
jgi:TolB-like protein/class 3 adenylate cyclase